MPRPPLPPFTEETAALKARLAENAWNTRDPLLVAQGYSHDSAWRHRHIFLQGRDAIVALLTEKWAREHDYRLIKEVWGFRGNRMAVRFAYESQTLDGDWVRSHGVELWAFDAEGLMRRRVASVSDEPITEAARLFRWPLGPRPDDHPGLSDLGL